VFEDTNGDHTFDKRTVVLEGVNLISGLEYGFGGIWVGAAPYLMFIPIQDGETPKPAGDPQILLDGWNYTADTHETLNTFTWGPDGWLYGCHGVFCPSNVGKPGTPANERQWMDAGVWRYHPTRHVFEVFTEGGSNPWGIDFDEHGQLFAEMCVIPHFWHMIQGARIERQGGEHFCINRGEIERNERYRDARSGKPVFPFVYDDIKQHGDHVHWAGNLGPHAANARSDSAGGGHAHAGVMCYLGTSWPEEFRGKMFLGNIHGQRINVDIPVRDGSGFVGKHAKDFLSFNDIWSQTLNQLYDQDGSMYIIDWYDKNQCHHNREDGHDRSNGRIYKVVYNDQKPARVDLSTLSDEELVKLVPSKNEWLSRHSRRVLQERSAKTLEPRTRVSLSEIVGGNSSGTEKLRALWALQVTGGIGLRDYFACLKSSDEWLRGWAIQLAFESPGTLARLGEEKIPANDEQLLKTKYSLNELAASDPSPLVRLFIASALQRMPVEHRSGFLTDLLKRSEDANDHNLPFMYWFAAEAYVASNPDGGLELLTVCKIPKVREFIARRLATTSLTSAK
jgi:putative membrane-bound dehydrogenase-like protein